MTFSLNRILLSGAVLVFATAAIASGTGAFFNDSETSTGNTLSAGAIDLKIDNHAWYNGLECAWDAEQQRYEWTGSSQDAYTQSLVGQPCTGTWDINDLTNQLFFKLDDLKPGDWEEDTISMHVDYNDAWMCSTLTLTSNDDVSSAEPELDEPGEQPEDQNNTWDGELAQELQFIFWADDGDNVYEDDEQIVLRGTPADLKKNGKEVKNGDDLYGYAQTFPLADASFSIFGTPGKPITGGEENVYYIGKAFCFGQLTPAPVPQGDNSPAQDPGFDCNGAPTSNISQTDSITADIGFSAVQARNNAGYLCNPPVQQPTNPAG